MIEIGKTYRVEPTYKKSVEEHEIFENADKTKYVNMIQLWRWGTWYVTPQNQEEVDMLLEGMEQSGLCITDFEEYEMDSTFDGQSTDFEYWGKPGWTEEEKEEFEADYFENFFEAFERRDLESYDLEVYIHCAVTAVEEEAPWVG